MADSAEPGHVKSGLDLGTVAHPLVSITEHRIYARPVVHPEFFEGITSTLPFPFFPAPPSFLYLYFCPSPFHPSLPQGSRVQPSMDGVWGYNYPRIFLKFSV